MSALTEQGFRAALADLGIAAGSVVYVTGNLGRLGILRGVSDPKTATMAMYRDVLMDVLTDAGTLIFPTHSWSIKTSGEPFDRATTPAAYAFSEHLRTHLPALRTNHALASIAVVGAQAEAIAKPRNRRTPYGVLSSFDAMTRAGAVHLSLGLPARRTITAVHHCEVMANVPYRYLKEFVLPVREDGVVRGACFYLNVNYLDFDLTRNRNQRIFAIPEIENALRATSLGRGIAQAMPLDHFVPRAIEALFDDPYLWLDAPPGTSPLAEVTWTKDRGTGRRTTLRNANRLSTKTKYVSASLLCLPNSLFSRDLVNSADQVPKRDVSLGRFISLAPIMCL